MLISRSLRFHWVVAATILFAATMIGPAPPAQAQAIVTAVNGDPITTFDVDEHAKLLKLARRPAGRNDALEDAIADRLKSNEAQKWGIDPSDSDVQSVIGTLAEAAKLAPDAWLQTAQKSRIDPDTIRAHVRALASWNAYVRSRNKGLGATDEEVSAQLAKQGTNAKITDYDLRQVVFVVPVNAGPAVFESRMRDAQALRARFSDCDTGLQLARGMQDVAVKERMTRTSDSLGKPLRTLLADVPSGHLTAPQRTPSGIEMVAVCNRSEDSGQTTLRDRVQTEIVNGKLQEEAERMYKDLRKAAVLSKL